MPSMIERMPVFDVWHAGRYLGQVVKQSEHEELWLAFSKTEGQTKMHPVGTLAASSKEAATHLCEFHGLTDDSALFDDER